MLYLALTRSWMVSRRAQRLYLCCACLHLSLLGVLVGTQMAMLESGVAYLADSPASLLLVKVLMWPGILGAALLLVAMWYFWFSYDPSNWLKKAFWFGILFVGNPLEQSSIISLSTVEVRSWMAEPRLRPLTQRKLQIS